MKAVLFFFILFFLNYKVPKAQEKGKEEGEGGSNGSRGDFLLTPPPQSPLGAKREVSSEKGIHAKVRSFKN